VTLGGNVGGDPEARALKKGAEWFTRGGGASEQ